MGFLSTPSARRATSDLHQSTLVGLFLSTPSARRATTRTCWIFCYRWYFYPRPPRGGRHQRVDGCVDVPRISIHALREEGDVTYKRGDKTALTFLSTPSARRATGTDGRIGMYVEISIHALREEGDGTTPETLSIRSRFLSTPSARRATVQADSLRHPGAISIHALREEGDAHCQKGGCLPCNFYPRPPRGGRLYVDVAEAFDTVFLSTPSARRATRCCCTLTSCLPNFYPRPPRGGRRQPLKLEPAPMYFYPRPPRGGRPRGPRRSCRGPEHFYPRPPRGGRLQVSRAAPSRMQFLSTPSARRATAKTETKSLFSNKLYNILHEFRRALIYNGSKSYPNHAK